MTPTDTAKLADMMEEIIESRMATIYDDELRAAAAALRELEAVKAREAKLREALEPFAIFGEIITADPLMDPHADDTPAAILLFADGARRMLTFGDLRRAHAARALQGDSK